MLGTIDSIRKSKVRSDPRFSGVPFLSTKRASDSQTVVEIIILRTNSDSNQQPPWDESFIKYYQGIANRDAVGGVDAASQHKILVLIKLDRTLPGSIAAR